MNAGNSGQKPSKVSERTKSSKAKAYIPEKTDGLPFLSSEEVERLSRQGHAGDSRAFHELVLRNKSLVISIAKPYRGLGLSMDDLIQEGLIGAMEAAVRFDPSFEVKFSTYARWWIRKAICEALTKTASIIRITRYQKTELKRLLEMQKRLQAQLAQEPHSAELEYGLEEVDAKVLSILQLPFDQRVCRLEDRVKNTNGNLSVGDCIADNSTVLSLDALYQQYGRIENLHTAMSQLPKQEARVLILRYGLHGDKPLSLGRIGQIIHCTRERVRQIQENAEKRLRQIITTLQRRRQAMKGSTAQLAREKNEKKESCMRPHKPKGAKAPRVKKIKSPPGESHSEEISDFGLRPDPPDYY